MSQTKVENIINFHGIVLWVIRHEGVEYVAAKPLSDLAKVDWRSAKRTFQHDENVILYGTKWLTPPDFAGQGGTSTPSNDEKTLYIRLDRATLYLARISTRNMAAKGATEAAERLLALQVEWAEALHQYETIGVARKKDVRESRNQLVGLIKVRALANDPAEKKALTSLIYTVMSDAGCPVNKIVEEQRDMFNGGEA